MFRSYDHPQGAHFVPCLSYSNHSTKLMQRSKSLSVLNCNFSKKQSMFPEDDRMIETCMSVLRVLM